MSDIYTNIKLRQDGSYEVIKNGWPYHIPNEGEFTAEFATVDAYAKAHPEEVTIEPPLTLAELKDIKLEKVKTTFDQHVTGSFMCSLGFPMQFNETDSVKMEGAIKLLEADNQTEGYLTDANNETHYNVPLASIKAVLIEMLSTFATAHVKKQQLRAQVEACTTKIELDAITISF